VRNRVRSPSSAPPERFDEGSTAITPMLVPFCRQRPISAPASVDLPTPGGPVSPITCARGADQAASSRSRVADASGARSSSASALASGVLSPAFWARCSVSREGSAANRFRPWSGRRPRATKRLAPPPAARSAPDRANRRRNRARSVRRSGSRPDRHHARRKCQA